jgi:hypothetical protein
MNHNELENEYKGFFGKVIDEETYKMFYQYLYQKYIHLNIGIYLLLSLLRQKKIRNFKQHSDLSDFFLDSVNNCQYDFIHLIEKHQIQDVLDPDHFNALKTIFETYFQHHIARARRLEEQCKNKAM